MITKILPTSNEVIGAAIIAVIAKSIELPIANAMLVMPLLLSGTTTRYISRRKSVIRSVEELVLAHPQTLINIQQRYLSHATPSINALSLAMTFEWCSFSNGTVCEGKAHLPSSDNHGKRYRVVANAAEKCSSIFGAPPAHLYYVLRITP